MNEPSEHPSQSISFSMEEMIQHQALKDLLNLKCVLASDPRDHFWRLLVPGILRMTRCQAVSLTQINQRQRQARIRYCCYSDERDSAGDDQDVHYWEKSRHAERSTRASSPKISQYQLNAHPVLSASLPFTERRSASLKHENFGGQSQVELMWTERGARERILGWPYVELLCQALEGVIEQRMLAEAECKLPTNLPVLSAPPSVSTQSSRLAKQAGLLSHELRTPMQGIIGTLDLMHHSIEMARDAVQQADAPNYFEGLHQDIEALQESARRAAEAAENITKAWELNACKATDGTQQMPIDATVDSTRPCGLKRRRSDSDYDTAYRPKTRGTHSLRVPLFNPRGHRAKDMYTVGDHHQAHCPELSRDALDSTPASGFISKTHPRHVSDVQGTLERLINDLAPSCGKVRPSSSESTEQEHTIEVRGRANNGSRTVTRLQWTVDSQIPATARCDASALTNTLRALLSNAFKFTNDGLILLNVTVETEGMLHLTVRDNGCGIPQHRQTAIFEAFGQADDSILRTTEGLGLGLTLAREAARKAGGEIILLHSSTEGEHRGSTFELTLPFEHDHHTTMLPTPPTTASPTRELEPIWEQPTREATPASPRFDRQTPFGAESLSSVVANERPSLTRRSKSSRHSSRSSLDLHTNLALSCPLNILVAEDNAINRRLLNSMLARLGYSEEQITLAVDGREAVERVQETLASHKVLASPETLVPHQTLAGSDGLNPSNTSHPRLFDLILMDLWMPYKDGYTATREILHLHDSLAPTLPKPTIVAVTADATDATALNVVETGMQGVLLKPFGVKKLERLLREVWEGRSSDVDDASDAEAA